MIKILLYSFIGLILIILIGLSIITIKYYRDKKAEDNSQGEYQFDSINGIGTVKNLAILPLVEYYSTDPKLKVESGVAYLIEADGKKILYDVGFNRENKHPSALLSNMEILGITPQDLDCIFISHLHVDHVGGFQAKKNSSFAISGEEIDLKEIKAYVPTKMVHNSAEVEIITKPTKIAEGIVSLGPVNRAVWGMGLTAEQALAINVEGKGIVLIVGCGHQTIEKVIKQTEQLFNIPIHAVFGGLHFPVTSRPGDFVFNVRKRIGTGKPPWNRIQKSEVQDTITFLTRKSISKIGISAHDSCDWTITKFKEIFLEKYKDLLVGKKIVIDSQK